MLFNYSVFKILKTKSISTNTNAINIRTLKFQKYEFIYKWCR